MTLTMVVLKSVAIPCTCTFVRSKGVKTEANGKVTDGAIVGEHVIAVGSRKAGDKTAAITLS